MARLLRISAGFAMLIAGVFMLVLPGPGILTIVGGLALLARDLRWAKRLELWARRRFSSYVEPGGHDSGRSQSPSEEQA